MSEYLWVEKYRPQKIEDCILTEELKKTFSQFVKQGEIPNLLLSGTAGTGKTTVAKALCNELGADYIVINGSDEGRQIDTLRNKIKNFASTMSLEEGSNHKVVIIDEADTIKLHKDCQVQFNFLWLITGTPTGLIASYKPIPFIGKFYKDDSLNISKSLVIKNDDNYVDQSIILPHPKRFKIKCITPKELSIIRNLIPGNVLQMINAGNSEQAIKTLNCNVDTNDNILQVITKNLTDSIKNKEREIEFEKGRIVIGDLIKEKEQRLNFLTNQLIKLNEKYENIKTKIYQLNDEYCPVCMDEFNNPTLVSC